MLQAQAQMLPAKQRSHVLGVLAASVQRLAEAYTAAGSWCKRLDLLPHCES
jgi:hypothetical protein